MITELTSLLQDFPGAVNRSRCFTHTLNLAAKSIIRQFDLPKKQGDAAMSDAANELAKLAENLEIEEILSRPTECEDGEGEDDNVEGWLDENEFMSDEEKEEWDEAARPVRLVLVKVRLFLSDQSNLDTSQLRKFAYAVKNSPTILLPRWFLSLGDLALSEHIMPRDVTTRWNSTFDMLDFAIEYRKALQLTTSDLDLNLRQYELSRAEWAIAQQLRNVLKVGLLLSIMLNN
jgi:hypothetical protein